MDIRQNYQNQQFQQINLQNRSMEEWEKNTEYKNNIPHDMQELLDIGVYSEYHFDTMHPSVTLGAFFLAFGSFAAN